LSYHEDGLIGTFSFDLDALNRHCKGSFFEDDISIILDHLAREGIVVPANLNNRQIQFKDIDAKRTIEQSKQKVYVKFDRPLKTEDLILPKRYNSPEVRDFILNTIHYKSACNYCSAKALNPLEATIHSTPVNAREPHGELRSTVRNYQFGFTFAPFGDPNTLCHFLAWDFPHINDVVMNMDPQWYSFSDLIKLVTVINRDIAAFCKEYKIENVPTVSGVCNHWAGNSIYHQHYQFFMLTDIPVLTRGIQSDITQVNDVLVRRLDWAMPVYEITSDKNDDEDVTFVADEVAKHWDALNEGYDYSYGNGIRITNYTQNIFVTQAGGKTRAIFVPRFRSKLNATGAHSQYRIEKNNMGVLETLGYFLIDGVSDFQRLEKLQASERNELGTAWLAEIAPPETSISGFEKQLCVELTTEVVAYNNKLGNASNHPTIESRRDHLLEEMSLIKTDRNLGQEQRLYLLREVNKLLFNNNPNDVFDDVALQDTAIPAALEILV